MVIRLQQPLRLQKVISNSERLSGQIALQEMSPTCFNRFKVGMKGTLWYNLSFVQAFTKSMSPLGRQLEAVFFADGEIGDLNQQLKNVQDG